MVDVEFNYQQNMIIIQGNLNDSFETIIKKYIIKSNLDKIIYISFQTERLLTKMINLKI